MHKKLKDLIITEALVIVERHYEPSVMIPVMDEEDSAQYNPEREELLWYLEVLTPEYPAIGIDVGINSHGHFSVEISGVGESSLTHLYPKTLPWTADKKDIKKTEVAS